MRRSSRSFVTYAGTASVVIAVVALASGSVSGQQPATTARANVAPAAAKPYTPKRTPDGKPDLQGTYDISTITPFERPQGAGETISETDAVAREKQTLERRDRINSVVSNPNREAPPVGGDGSTGAAGSVGGYNNFWLDQGDTWIIINGQRRSAIVVDPPTGRVPPRAAAAGRGRGVAPAAPALPRSDAPESVAPTGRGAYDNIEQRPLGERCILGFDSTSGPPTLPNGFYNNTKLLVQTPEYVMILNEMVHDARIIRMNSKHQPSHIRSWMGDSIGWWEGDTLVIETTNFTNKTRYSGTTENLKVTERISRMSDGNLLYRFTIDDPATFTRPWSGEYPWRRTEAQLFEYACHEGNHAMGNIMRGARLLEKEAEEARRQR